MACSAQWNFVNDFLWFTLKHPTEKYTFALFNPFFFFDWYGNTADNVEAEKRLLLVRM